MSVAAATRPARGPAARLVGNGLRDRDRGDAVRGPARVVLLPPLQVARRVAAGRIADPKLLKPAVMTVFLMTSSLTVWYGERAVRRDDMRGLRVGLALTFLLGIGFLVLQVTEYRELLREIHPSTDAYASSFFTITGLHGAHVAAGLLVLAWTQFFAWRGAYRSEEHVAVQTSALYWHFVHVVWLFLFLALYLSPRL